MKDKFSKKYDSAIFLGDFNTCIFDNAMTSFCSLSDLASLIDQPTCYKYPEKPTCIDWFIDLLIDWLIDRLIDWLIQYLRFAVITSNKTMSLK